MAEDCSNKVETAVEELWEGDESLFKLYKTIKHVQVDRSYLVCWLLVVVVVVGVVRSRRRDDKAEASCLVVILLQVQSKIVSCSALVLQFSTQ